MCIKRSLLSPRTWLFCHSRRAIFLVSRGLAPGRPRQTACSALSDRAGLGFAVASRASGLRAPLRALRDSVSHASSQRRAAGLAVSVRLPGAPPPAEFQPAQRGVLSNGRRESQEETAQRPPPTRARQGRPSPATGTRSAGHATQPADKPARPAQPAQPAPQPARRRRNAGSGTAVGRGGAPCPFGKRA